MTNIAAGGVVQSLTLTDRPDRLPGIRGRIGVIQPAPGLMLEKEWGEFMPEGVMFPVTRLALSGGSDADYVDMSSRAPSAAALLATFAPHCIAYACGIGSLFQGPVAEAALLGRISAAANGIQAIGIGQAVGAALAHLGVSRVALLTPYAQDTNDTVVAYLDAIGITVRGIYTLPTLNAITAASLTAVETSRAVALAFQGSPDADALWIPCTNVGTLDLIDSLETAHGRAVISSNQALLWHALRCVADVSSLSFSTSAPLLSSLPGRLFS